MMESLNTVAEANPYEEGDTNVIEAGKDLQEEARKDTNHNLQNIKSELEEKKEDTSEITKKAEEELRTLEEFSKTNPENGKIYVPIGEILEMYNGNIEKTLKEDEKNNRGKDDEEKVEISVTETSFEKEEKK